ncbi:MAG: hypothetical protein NZM11_12010 [Anaerolineales bacterium]|nr:hypothetical protein [Anaerolineales bacterium]
MNRPTAQKKKRGDGEVRLARGPPHPYPPDLHPSSLRAVCTQDMSAAP